MTTPLLRFFVEVCYELHCLAGDGVLSRLEVMDAALDMLVDLAWEAS
jgi:hypothetical protein